MRWPERVTLAMAVVSASAFIVLRFQHPEWTETQLLMRGWYWLLPAVLAVAVIALRRRQDG